MSNGLGDGDFNLLRDMVFQCAIFQTSAAIESYIKLIVESWAQKIVAHSGAASVPATTRGYFAHKRLAPHFKRFAFQEEEAALHRALIGDDRLWPFLSGGDVLPPFFDGRAIHDACAYPSFKNLKKLFSRIGIDNLEARLSKKLKRDSETLIESFQSIRTALAHSSPPQITIDDVRDRIDEQIKLVAAIDSILYWHFHAHGGPQVWVPMSMPLPD